MNPDKITRFVKTENNSHISTFTVSSDNANIATLHYPSNTSDSAQTHNSKIQPIRHKSDIIINTHVNKNP